MWDNLCTWLRNLRFILKAAGDHQHGLTGWIFNWRWDLVMWGRKEKRELAGLYFSDRWVQSWGHWQLLVICSHFSDHHSFTVSVQIVLLRSPFWWVQSLTHSSMCLPLLSSPELDTLRRYAPLRSGLCPLLDPQGWERCLVPGRLSVNRFSDWAPCARTVEMRQWGGKMKNTRV